MGGGGGGGGGRSYSTSRDRPPAKTTMEEIEKKVEEKSDFTNLKNNEEDIKNFVKIEMEKALDNLPWDHNDHSIKHVSRVLKNFSEVVKNFEELSFSKEFLKDNKLSKLDKEILRYAIILHDIGYSKSIKEHSLASKEYIEKINRGIKESIIKDIAIIAQLHTPEGIKKLGGSSLTDLVKKGKIGDRIAFLASILTISDALDAGKQRVMQNSQNEPANRVIKRIKTQYSTIKAESKLEHWFGHQGFSNPLLNKKNGNFNLSIKLDTNLSEKYGTKIAFRIVDIISDITTSHISSSKKFNLELRILSKNKEKANKWYSENRLIFLSEEKLSSNVKILGIEED